MHRGHVVSAAALACLLVLPLTAGAATIHVPADQPTIQAAIDVAHDGDTILLANGIYAGPGNRDIVVGFKIVQIASEGGSSNCIIDLQGHSGIRIGNAQYPLVNASTVSIDGLTIRNAAGAGALFVDSFSTLFASNCRLVDNAGVDGGAVHVENYGDVFASRCIFLRNRGGAVVHYGDECILSRCAFFGNQDGAVFGWLAQDFDEVLVVLNSLFVGNSIAMGVGGFAFSSHPLAGAENCTLVDNGSGIDVDIIGGGSIDSDNLYWNSPAPGSDPLFVRNPSPGPDGVWGTLDDDYGDLHLRPGSYAVDSADFSFAGFDYDGNPRPVGPAGDLGAYELQGARLVATVVSVRQSTTRYGVTVRLTNTGNETATVIKVLTATLNGTAATPPMPMTLSVTLPPGAWADVFTAFPKSVGAHGQTVPFAITGSYKSGALLFPLSHTEDVILP